MQAGAGGFANRIQTRGVGARGEIGDYAAAGEVHRRHHRNRLSGDIDAERQATRVDGWKVFFQKCFRLVRDVQKHAVQPAFFHFIVDRPRDHVARRQLGAFIVMWHETGAIGQFQDAAFSAHCLADQERLGVGVE